MQECSLYPVESCQFPNWRQLPLKRAAALPAQSEKCEQSCAALSSGLQKEILSRTIFFPCVCVFALRDRLPLLEETRASFISSHSNVSNNIHNNRLRNTCQYTKSECLKNQPMFTLHLAMCYSVSYNNGVTLIICKEATRVSEQMVPVLQSMQDYIEHHYLDEMMDEIEAVIDMEHRQHLNLGLEQQDDEVLRCVKLAFDRSAGKNRPLSFLAQR